MTAGVIAPEAGARRLTRLIREVSIGQTPTGNWDQLRNTGGDGLAAVTETTESNELSGGGALGQRDQIRTGLTGNFTYPCELSKDGPFELLFESLLQSDFAANTLTPGATDITFTLEDELPSVQEFEYLRGARANVLTLTVNANEVVTAEFAGAGTDPGVVPLFPEPAESGVTLSGSDITDATNASNATIGGYVQLTNAATDSDNGYYKITNIAGNVITVDGTFAGASADAQYTGKSISDGQTTNPKGSNTPFSAGDSVKLELSEDGGSSWFDSLVYGWRVPSLTLNVGTEVSDLREITESAPYVQVAVSRTVGVTFDWHVINLSPVRLLNADTEFGLRFEVNDGTNWYRFTMPRCKFAESSKGPAANGSEMTGNSTLNALLNSSDINLQIDRNA